MDCRKPLQRFGRYSAKAITSRALVYGRLSHFRLESDRTLGAKTWFSLWFAVVSYFQSSDFERFLEDRWPTIRVWSALGGNSHLMEPNYSLRGLETFQSTIMSGKVQSMRSKHHCAVMNEQERQRTSSNAWDPYSLANVSVKFSSWAKERAVRLGMEDSVDASAYQLDTSSSSAVPSFSTLPFSKLHGYSSVYKSPPFDVRDMMPKSHASSAASRESLAMLDCSTSLSFLSRKSGPPMSLREMIPKSHASTAASRESLSKFSGLGGRGPCSHNSVDETMLKQLNMEFLRGFVHRSGLPSASCSDSTTSCSLHSPDDVPPSSFGTLDLLTEALNTTADTPASMGFGYGAACTRGAF